MPTYWASIQNTILGLMHFHILAIFHWHFSMYSCICSQEIANNKIKLMQLWDPHMPFTMLVEQFHECQQSMTNGNNAFTVPQQINKMLHLIIQMVAFLYNVCKWNNHDSNEKTFHNIITNANCWSCNALSSKIFTSRLTNSWTSKNPSLLQQKQPMPRTLP